MLRVINEAVKRETSSTTMSYNVSLSREPNGSVMLIDGSGTKNPRVLAVLRESEIDPDFLRDFHEGELDFVYLGCNCGCGGKLGRIFHQEKLVYPV